MSLPGRIFSIIMMLCVLGGTHYYIARRIYQCVIYLFPQINPRIYASVFTVAAFVMVFGFARSLLPLPAAVKNILGFSSYWMGTLIYLLLFLAMADIFLFAGSVIKIFPNPIPADIRFFSGAAAIFLTTVTVGYGIYTASQIKTTSYDIQIDKQNIKSELNIVLVSDLHLGAVDSEKRLAKIVQEINNLNPDLICIAGDIFDNDYYAIQEPDKAVQELRRMKSAYGVYAVLGNHDGGETLPQMLHFLERSNINILKDEYVVLDGRLVLAGRLDGSPIGGFQGMKRGEFTELMAEVDENLPVVVMDHNPANMDEYANETDLILCGHTHRGQIFPGSLFTGAMFTIDYGHYQKDSVSPHVIVTSGAGTWGMPMRVGTNCEIVHINLHESDSI